MAEDRKQLRRFDEINVGQLSLISVQERIPADFREWTVEHQDESRRYRVVCQALPEYGVPHGTDNDVSAALINLFIEQGLPADGTVMATPYVILQAAGLDTSGRYYEALDKSLKRLLTTNFFISEGWRDHPSRRWTTASFRYVDKLEYTTASGEEGFDPTSILKIHLPAELVRSVRAGYIKPLDLAFMQSLKRPPTRALYRLLDARRHNAEDPSLRLASFQIPLMEWAQACKIVSDRPSLVERPQQPPRRADRARLPGCREPAWARPEEGHRVCLRPDGRSAGPPAGGTAHLAGHHPHPCPAADPALRPGRGGGRVRCLLGAALGRIQAAQQARLLRGSAAQPRQVPIASGAPSCPFEEQGWQDPSRRAGSPPRPLWKSTRPMLSRASSAGWSR